MYVPVGLGTVLDGTGVVPADLGCGASVTLALLVSDVKGYSKRVLMCTLITLKGC